MKLTWLAGGSYIEILAMTGLPLSTVYYMIDRTMAALDDSLEIPFEFEDKVSNKDASYGFSINKPSPLRGCIAALNGLARTGCAQSLSLLNQKGFFRAKHETSLLSPITIPVRV